MYTVEFDENQRFVGVHTNAKNGTISDNTANVKVFAWNKDNKAPLPEFEPSHFDMKDRR